MFPEQEYEEIIYCPECRKPMYQLKETISEIYVCPCCGASLDEKRSEGYLYKQKDCSNCEKQILFKQIFSDHFMKKYTDFNSFSEFINDFDILGRSIEKVLLKDITKIPEREINIYVNEHTRFSTWDQMFEKAVELYLKV